MKLDCNNTVTIYPYAVPVCLNYWSNGNDILYIGVENFTLETAALSPGPFIYLGCRL